LTVGAFFFLLPQQEDSFGISNTALMVKRKKYLSAPILTFHLQRQGWNRDAIERQLAHVERNSVRASYNYAEYLPERRKMMQAWADYLDSLKKNGESGRMVRMEDRFAEHNSVSPAMASTPGN